MEEIIKLQEEFESLIEQLERLKSINELTAANTESTKQIISQADNFTASLGQITKTYLEENNTLFVEKIKELHTNIKLFETEVIRLIDTDFTSLFDDLQKAFIIKTKADVEIELHKFDEKVRNFQPIIDSLKNEVERLKSIDLEKYFNKFQKTLADIQDGVNLTNYALTSVTQSISGIVQSIGLLEASIGVNFKETNQQISSFNKSLSEQLGEQNKNISRTNKEFDEKLSSLSKENELLKKEIKTNRIIQIVGFVIIMATVIFMTKFI